MSRTPRASPLFTIGLEMTRFALRQFGVSQPETQAIVAGLRHRG